MKISLSCSLPLSIAYLIYYYVGIFGQDCLTLAVYGRFVSAIIAITYSTFIIVVLVSAYHSKEIKWKIFVFIFLCCSITCAIPFKLYISRIKTNPVYCMCSKRIQSCEQSEYQKLFFLLFLLSFVFIVISCYLVAIEQRSYRAHEPDLPVFQRFRLALPLIAWCLYGVYGVFQKKLQLEVIRTFKIEDSIIVFHLITPFQYFFGSFGFPFFVYLINRRLISPIDLQRISPENLQRIYPIFSWNSLSTFILSWNFSSTPKNGFNYHLDKHCIKNEDENAYDTTATNSS